MCKRDTLIKDTYSSIFISGMYDEPMSLYSAPRRRNIFSGKSTQRGYPSPIALGFPQTQKGFYSTAADRSALFKTQKGFYSLQLAATASFRRRLSYFGYVGLAPIITFPKKRSLNSA